MEIDSNIYYNDNLVKDANTVITTASDAITEYGNSIELNKYGARFKYSKFLKVIDDSHRSITSNITTVAIRRDMVPAVNSFANYEICYGNSFHIKSLKVGYNIKSSGFKVSGISETVYFGDLPTNKEVGSIFLFKLDAEEQPVVLRSNIGTINYTKGEIIITSLNIISTSKSKDGKPIIEISACPSSNDVIGKQDLYLQLDNSQVKINAVNDGIESGSDISGFSYVSTSSYINGKLVRS